MRFASPVVGILILILLVAIPVGGTPNLQKGSIATYNLTVEISFARPTCQMVSTTSSQQAVIACPTIATTILDTNITGTLGWEVTSLTTTAAALNVTRDVTISHEGLMIPDHHSVGSFNESIDLASRIITIIPPFLTTEMDNALQMDSNTGTTLLLTGTDSNMAMNAVEASMAQLRPVYTMWWMNETLHQGQTVPVLVFPTEVVRAGSFEFQGTQRSTWILQFNKTLPSPQPDVSSSLSAWVGNGLSSSLTFEYDQTGGLLLSATADIHVGFIEPLLQPVSCDESATNSPTVCVSPNSSQVFTSLWGLGIHASLSLANTSINLDKTLGSTPSGSSTGSGSASGAGSGPGGSSGGGSGTGPGGSGGSSGGGSGGSSSGGSGRSGSGPSGGSGPGAGGSNSGGTPSPVSVQPPAGLAPWIYLAIATLIVAIIAIGLWIARKQSRKGSLQSPSGQSTS